MDLTLKVAGDTRYASSLILTTQLVFFRSTHSYLPFLPQSDQGPSIDRELRFRLLQDALRIRFQGEERARALPSGTELRHFVDADSGRLHG